MSWEARLAVLKASLEPGRYTDAEFRVLMVLADHMNSQTGRCDPSLKLLAEETDKDRGYLVRILNALARKGEIARADPSSKGGKHHRQGYALPLKGDHQSPFAADERVTGSTTKGDSQHHQRVTARSSDQHKREQPGIEPGKNQRERAGSTPNGAGRARRDDPTPLAVGDFCTHEVGDPSCHNLCRHRSCARDCGTCNDWRLDHHQTQQGGS